MGELLAYSFSKPSSPSALALFKPWRHFLMDISGKRLEEGCGLAFPEGGSWKILRDPADLENNSLFEKASATAAWHAGIFLFYAGFCPRIEAMAPVYPPLRLPSAGKELAFAGNGMGNLIGGNETWRLASNYGGTLPYCPDSNIETCSRVIAGRLNQEELILSPENARRIKQVIWEKVRELSLVFSDGEYLFAMRQKGSPPLFFIQMNQNDAACFLLGRRSARTLQRSPEDVLRFLARFHPAFNEFVIRAEEALPENLAVVSTLPYRKDENVVKIPEDELWIIKDGKLLHVEASKGPKNPGRILKSSKKSTRRSRKRTKEIEAKVDEQLLRFEKNPLFIDWNFIDPRYDASLTFDAYGLKEISKAVAKEAIFVSEELEEKLKRLCNYFMSIQRKRGPGLAVGGCWCEFPPEVGMPIDARRDFIYTPTYFITAFFSSIYIRLPHIAQGVTGFKRSLLNALYFCSLTPLRSYALEILMQGMVHWSLAELISEDLRLVKLYKEFEKYLQKAKVILHDKLHNSCDWDIFNQWTPEKVEDVILDLCDAFSSMELPAREMVFVYGTLKKGFGNHGLLQGAKFIGKAVTTEPYAMYVSGGIPFVTPNEKVSPIKGEVYFVDETTLSSLDRLEGHPDWYCRRETWVELEDGREVHAWLYFNQEPSGTLESSGEFGR